MIVKFQAMVKRHNINLMTFNTPGYKAIVSAVAATSGVNLPVKSGEVQRLNAQLKQGEAVIFRQSLLMLRDGKLYATNNKHLINAAAKGVIK